NDWLVDKLADMQAEQAWTRLRRDARAQPMSDDFGDGFKQGYVASLRRSGWVETPTAAPQCYAAPRYQTAEGHHAIQDWFHGYRHGADLARESNLLDSSTRQVSATAVPPPPEQEVKPAASAVPALACWTFAPPATLPPVVAPAEALAPP